MLYWKHAIWKAVSGTTMILLGAVTPLALLSESLSPATKQAIAIVVSTLGAAIKGLDMFFDQTIARLAAGKTPVPLPGINGNGGDTAHITKG